MILEVEIRSRAMLFSSAGDAACARNPFARYYAEAVYADDHYMSNFYLYFGPIYINNGHGSIF